MPRPLTLTTTRKVSRMPTARRGQTMLLSPKLPRNGYGERRQPRRPTRHLPGRVPGFGYCVETFRPP